MLCKLETLLDKGWLQQASTNRNTLESIRTDGDGEYIKNKFKNCVMPRVIVHEILLAYSSESNGAAERLNQILLQIARASILGTILQR